MKDARSGRVETALQRLWFYLRPYKTKVCVGILCSLIANLVRTIGPIVLQRALDGLSHQIADGRLLQYGILIMAIALIEGVFLFFQERLVMGTSIAMERDLRNDFYRHLQKLPMDFFRTHRIGELMAKATSDLRAATAGAGQSMVISMNTLLAALVILPSMARVNLRLTLLALVPLLLVLVVTHLFHTVIHDRVEKVQSGVGALSNWAQEALAGVRTIRAFSQERGAIDTFRKINRQFMLHNLGLVRLSGITFPLMQFIVGIGSVAVLWYGGRLIARGVLSVGEFVEFTVYFGYLAWPMNDLGWSINIFQRGMVSMERLHSTMSLEPAIHDEQRASDLQEIAGAIEFRDVTYGYPGAARPAVRGINLRVEPGRTVALVGPVGSGKSTLVNMVPRLLEAGSGQVFIDGHAIQQIPLQLLRSSLGYVPQEPFLFSDTIAANIAFGADSASIQEIEQAAAEAGLAEDLASFSKGYNTLIGERGVTLSGGQRQRASLARAIVRRPRILLLDDAFSSVDTYTEATILKHLRKIMEGQACLMTAHRVSTIRHADEIVVLHEGQIVERGTHDELLARGGTYAEIYQKQQLEEEISAG